MSDIRKLSDQLYTAKKKDSQRAAILIAKRLAHSTPSNPEEAFDISMAMLDFFADINFDKEFERLSTTKSSYDIGGISLAKIHEIKSHAKQSHMTKFNRGKWRRFCRLVDKLRLIWVSSQTKKAYLAAALRLDAGVWDL